MLSGGSCMQKTLFSQHVPFLSLGQKDTAFIIADIELFNRMKRTATRRKSASAAPKKDKNAPDLRKKENAELRKQMPASIEIQFKETFGTDDYFTNSAIRSADAAVKSVRELKQMNLDRAEADVKDIADKIKSRKKRLKALRNIQKSLVKRSKARKAGRRIPSPNSNIIEVYKDGKWLITNFGKIVAIYENDYLFEISYLRPKIRQMESMIKSLVFRKNRLEHKISTMKADAKVHICYGSKDLFRKQDTVYDGHHDILLSAFRKHRNRSLTISGRKDAGCGNFLFSYDPASHKLAYRSQTKKGVVLIPNVVFPYGQTEVDCAVTVKKPERQAVAWSIEIHGQSFLIKCMLQAVSDGRINDDYSNGCIAVDSNYDCLAVTETDGSGNLLQHKIIPVDVTGCAGYNEQSISKALDQVFDMCRATHKPFAMEQLSMKSKPHLYGGKKRNRHTSLFSAKTITWLAQSKALRAGVACEFVDPAYTSQIGKMKYMRRYGLTIHEAASFAIARRAMGIRRERLPAWMRKDPDVRKKRTSPSTSKNVWKDVYTLTKKVKPSDRMNWSVPSFA